jgi:hypothetical protein
MIHFKGSHLEIKKNLNQTKKALLEDNQYKKANQNYLNELNKIYGDNIIDLNVSVSDSLKNKSIILDSNKDDNIIYLQNEIVSNLETTDNDIVINLTEEIKNEADELEPIIELTKGVTSELNEDKVGALVEEEAVEKEAIIDDLIEEKSLEAEIIDQSINNVNQTEEVFDLNNNITNNDNISADTTDTAEVIENNIQDSPSAAINEKFHDEITANKIKIDQLETSISQIEDLSGKVQDIENQNTLLFDKLDDLVNQNLNLSDKLDSDLDLKLDIASVKIVEKSDL